MRSEVLPSDQVTFLSIGFVLDAPPQVSTSAPPVGVHTPVKRARSLPSGPPPQAAPVSRNETSKAFSDLYMTFSWLVVVLRMRSYRAGAHLGCVLFGRARAQDGVGGCRKKRGNETPRGICPPPSPPGDAGGAPRRPPPDRGAGRRRRSGARRGHRPRGVRGRGHG